MQLNRLLGSVWQKLARLLGFGAPDSGEQSRKPSSPSSGSSTFSETKILKGDGSWCFHVRIDGEDLVCDSGTATWFGGCDDPLDNGETASGVKTCGNPDLMGCALPVVDHHPSTKGSPLAFRPRIPWGTKVIVQCGEKSIVVPLIDNGPAKSARDAIDLTQAAFKQFAPLKRGVIPVRFRILGGAVHWRASSRA